MEEELRNANPTMPSTSTVTGATTRSKTYVMYFILLLVTIIWGASWSAGKIVADNMNAIPAAFYRFLIALPFFFLAAFGIEKDLRIPSELHSRVAMLGFLQVSLYNFFFLTGLQFTNSSDAVLIIGINPAMTAVLASKLYSDENLTLNRIIGFGVALVGVGIVFLLSPNNDYSNRYLGNLIIFGAAFTWALFTVLARPIFKEVKPLTFTAWASLYGLIILMILVPFFGGFRVSDIEPDVYDDVIFSLIYLALLASVYGNIAFNTGVKVIGPSRSAIFVNLVPIFGVISSALILSEEISYWHILALILILTGVFLVNKKNQSTEI